MSEKKITPGKPYRIPPHINQIFRRVMRDDAHEVLFEDFVTLAAYSHQRLKAEQRSVLFWKMLQESADDRLCSAPARVVNGSREAIKCLRQIEKINWERNCPRKGAKALADALVAAWAWPTDERNRFIRVLSDLLTGAVLGSLPSLNDLDAKTH